MPARLFLDWIEYLRIEAGDEEVEASHPTRKAQSPESMYELMRAMFPQR